MTSESKRTRLTVEARRAQLLELGLNAFASKPYDLVSVEELAIEAGISKGLLFHYFSNKQDFYVAVLEIIAKRMLHYSLAAIDGNPLERLRTGLTRYYEFVGQYARLFTALYEAESSSIPKAREIVEKTRGQFIRTIEQHLPAVSGDQASLRRMTLFGWSNLVEAIAYDWVAHRDVPVVDLVETAIRASLLVPGVVALPGFAQVS